MRLVSWAAQEDLALIGIERRFNRAQHPDREASSPSSSRTGLLRRQVCSDPADKS
jgi:hypothetical protein